MDELKNYDWRWVVGCEGKYAITRCGKVYSIPRSMWNGRNVGGIFLTPLKGTKYLQVALPFNGKTKKTRPIHRIVCEAFHGLQPSPGHEVAHGDGVHKNNSADNLRWATKKENMDDQRVHGVLCIGESNGMSKLTKNVVLKIRKFHGDCMSFKNTCEEFAHISPNTIKDIIYRKTWKHI